MNLLALAILPFLSAPVAGWLGGRSSPAVTLLPLTLFVAFASFLSAIASGEVLIESQAWIRSLDIAAASRTHSPIASCRCRTNC